MAADVIVRGLDRGRWLPGRGRPRSRSATGTCRSRSRAWRAMARPRTWPPRSPRAAATRSTVGAAALVGTTSTTSGSPRVSVPVLSKASTRRRPKPPGTDPLDQDAPPRRGGQAADDRHGSADHQGAGAGDDEHDQAAQEPLAPGRGRACRQAVLDQGRPEHDQERPRTTTSGGVARRRTARCSARRAPGRTGGADLRRRSG